MVRQGAVLAVTAAEVPDAAAMARKLKVLPPDTILRLVSALTSGGDAAAHLPNGWRGFHSIIVDGPSPKAGDTVPVGTELLLVPSDEPVGEMASYAVVAPLHGSTVPLGTFTDQALDRSIELGRVRCWLADRRQTLRSPTAVVLFIAVSMMGPAGISWTHHASCNTHLQRIPL